MPDPIVSPIPPRRARRGTALRTARSSKVERGLSPFTNYAGQILPGDPSMTYLAAYLSGRGNLNLSPLSNSLP